MPRAFLITNRRYHSEVDFEENQSSRECSPERRVSTADGPLFGADSDGDSMGFHGPPFKQPTSPHSPAHESRSCQQSPVTGGTMYHPLDHTTPPPPQTFVHMAPTTPPPATASFRTAALVTVIRQLMQTQSPVNPHHHHPSPPSSSGPSSPDDNSMPDCHVCAECGKRYSTSSNLARHRQTHRSPTDKKARKCPHCDKVYVSMPAFSMHVRTHSQGCMCPYCGKCFSRPWLLQGHVRTHTGEKPFTCPVCRKAFADKSNLRAHVQTHSSSKPYVCRRCGKAFALKSYLYKHEESSCMRVHRQQQEPSNVVLDLAIPSGDRSNSSTGFMERDTGIRVG